MVVNCVGTAVNPSDCNCIIIQVFLNCSSGVRDQMLIIRTSILDPGVPRWGAPGVPLVVLLGCPYPI